MTIQAFTKTGCTFRLINPRTLRVFAGTVRDDVDGSTITVPETDIDINTAGAAGLDTGSIAAGTYAVYAQGPTSVTCVLSLAVAGTPTLVDSHTTYGFLGYVTVVQAASGIYQFSGTFDDYETALGPVSMVHRALAKLWSSLVGSVATAGTLLADIISEFTTAAGVTIDGVKLKDSEVYTDVIHEKTSATGVTADGVLLKDGTVTVTGDPSSALQLAPKQYVDAVATGLDVKASVRALAASNITLLGAQTIDGVSVIAGDRVLCIGQSLGATNGIYVAAAGAWSRATDADSSAEVTSGMFCEVREGTLYAATGWVLVTNDPIVLGTDVLTFAEFSARDTAALHVSTPSEIHGLSSVTPADADELVAEDASAGTAFAKVKFAMSAVASYVLGYIHSVTSKATPVAADEVILNDSAASYAPKRATLQAIFDALGGGGVPDVWYGHYPKQDPQHAKTYYIGDGLSIWTEYDVPANTTVSEDATHGIKILQTTHAGDTITGVYQAVPAVAEYTITAHIKASGACADYAQRGLFVAEDIAGAPSTANLAHINSTRLSSGATSMAASNHADYATFSANAREITAQGDGDRWFRIAVNATSIFCLWSDDGGETWVLLHSGNFASRGFSGAPQYMGVHANNVNTGSDLTVYCDAFIVTETADIYHSIGGRS